MGLPSSIRYACIVCIGYADVNHSRWKPGAGRNVGGNKQASAVTPDVKNRSGRQQGPDGETLVFAHQRQREIFSHPVTLDVTAPEYDVPVNGRSTAHLFS
jgi:hypothetical protein